MIVQIVNQNVPMHFNQLKVVNQDNKEMFTGQDSANFTGDTCTAFDPNRM